MKAIQNMGLRPAEIIDLCGALDLLKDRKVITESELGGLLRSVLYLPEQKPVDSDSAETPALLSPLDSETKPEGPEALGLCKLTGLLNSETLPSDEFLSSVGNASGGVTEPPPGAPIEAQAFKEGA